MNRPLLTFTQRGLQSRPRRSTASN